MTTEYFIAQYKCGCDCGHKHKTHEEAEKCLQHTAARHHAIHADRVADNADDDWGVFHRRLMEPHEIRQLAQLQDFLPFAQLQEFLPSPATGSSSAARGLGVTL